MKKLIYFTIVGALFLLVIAAKQSSENPYGFKKGTPEIKSISAMAFGPDGILFIGDSKAATVFAFDTKDKTPASKVENVEIKNIDQKIAASLGTEAKNIRIRDIAVNPISKKIYCAVENMDGTPILLKLDGESIKQVSFKDASYSEVSIKNVPGDEKDNRGRSLRDNVISDLAYADGSVMLSGISTQEFGSVFRKIDFPFTSKQDQASLEIYHAAHGRYETNAPIRTFTTATLNGKNYLVASYTCTPLVLFPMDDLKAGKLIRGRTVGEFGAGNSPIDMLTVKNGGNMFLVMANSSRPLMRVKYKNIENYSGSLTDPVKESFSTAGVDFVSLPVVSVVQMDKLDDSKVLILQRKGNGDLDLSTLTERMFS